jgi:UDP-galactopyranose mutase
MFKNVDLLIVGAGPVGCVVAHRAASELGLNCLIIDKRSHLGGNCHDRPHTNGVLVHAYGPHLFRTNDAKIIEYLSQFTTWLPGNYTVKSSIGGKLYSFPINLNTLESYFDRTFTTEEAKEFLENEREKIDYPKNSEEYVLSKVGKKLFESFYLGYSLKQWGIHPRDLSPEVCGRIPIRFNRDDRYVDHTYQLTPSNGFTSMFSKMINHPSITLQLGTDYASVKNKIIPKLCTLYTGPVDEYFEYKEGRLPWRSLNFEFLSVEKNFYQPCVAVNYPNDKAYTRSVEVKHITQQNHPHTAVSFETSSATGDPYYPIPSAGSQILYEKYRKMTVKERFLNKVYFAGRLATYRYINTDEAIQTGFDTFEEIKSELIRASKNIA